ncbi:Probable glucan endo-1,3-beta-glucosidase eglC [Taphrina deformans PYCC 5710]|uniref:glucan endo-1,3-beta-D-glucosidase n=1 Tax=Taphrina deformans (strain PYCC 5710 / ATCC 11124 / CBS 356.35 / IMI 108563 / JCM 9778 / NBRC 8474) TaxID=1097556 RepID=R4XF03_TAPDE|nr:Probable glucan endo-1,3-beta-glucosidase eglC [Taphrina deformans PYCC 5710]|eukprot:CCG81942.1 Probable glucan endo-1,3-beta-glucosidase eglC [Taphrina deformans PYCC 5710]
MINVLLPILLPSLANALPAPVPDAQPTLFTFTYAGNLVTATWTGTGAATAPAACPTQTFTYNGAAITVPYTGPAAATPAATTPAAGNVAPAPSATTSTTPAVAAATTAAASPAASSGVAKGFNYGSTGANGAPLAESDFLASFNAAKNLPGTSGFTSARLYTMIQAGTQNTPISAIPAAIASKTTLLLGLWASAGQANIDNEIAALKTAISQYGTAFTDLITGISVGSEDLYRDSPTGIENKSGVGAGPAEVASYIRQVKAAIVGTAAAGKLVGHVDAYPTWNNASVADVIAASDFIGLDAYPYFQFQMPNSIEQAADLFKTAYAATQSAAGGKPVWITETGFPTSGATSGNAVPSTANAKTYWDQIGCGFAFDKINTYWYTLNDQGASPAFGVDNGGTPAFDLSCPAA